MTADLSYDPYDAQISADPYPTYRRLRDEAPLYYNEDQDFFAVSRADDVERGLVDRDAFSNAKGDVLEFIKADIEFPSGTFIFDDPPRHTKHRGVISRVFTPRRVAVLEPRVRAFCATALDPLVGSGGFDFVSDLAAQMPMRVIGMLLGIPDDDQDMVRDVMDAGMETDPGRPKETEDLSDFLSGGMFAEYIDWRAEHPSDDLMTDLLNAEFEDETGTVRRLTREEVLVYVTLLAGAGSETTAKLIGWAGKVLADHPDQRRELADDPTLVPNAVEELLRFEPPTPHAARHVTHDAEIAGGTVPAGSALVCLIGAANRDERRFPDPDRFDIHRKTAGLLTFGFGAHYCIGNALARLEGRIAIEEVLARFPEWTVDEPNAKLVTSSMVRGWETLPVLV